MARCSYCKVNIKPGRGVTYVEVSGRIFYFCGSKCKKNHRMGRDPLRQLWITKRKEE